jgi:hypothetical protein
MKKAFVTIVANDTNAADLIREIQRVSDGSVIVLSQADINVSDKNLSTLPNQVWLHEADVNNEREFIVVADSTMRVGPALSPEELDVIQQFGVVVGFNAIYPDSTQYGCPDYVVHDESIQAEASTYGIPVAHELETNLTDGDDGSEVRWLRIAMPAWFKLEI